MIRALVVAFIIGIFFLGCVFGALTGLLFAQTLEKQAVQAVCGEIVLDYLNGMK